MKIKTFYAKTMAEAMQEIKVSLGADALLLSTKEIPSRSGGGGLTSGFEVVAASDETAGADQDSVSYPTAAEDSDSNPYSNRSQVKAYEPEAPGLTYTPSSLRRQQSTKPQAKSSSKAPVSRRRSVPVAIAQPREWLPSDDPLSGEIYANLIDNGIEEWLSRKLVTDARELLTSKQRKTRSAFLNAISHVANGLIASVPPGEGVPSRRIVVFLGPTGVGKTTSIAKLAARLTLQHKKKVVLVTLDRYRIGAVEQLKTYAGLMGVPFRFVGDVSELPRVIRDNGQRDFILVDTTGRSPKDLGIMNDLAEFLQKSDQTERHLLLSATTKARDLHEIVDGFEMCKPDRLLLTKLDETSSAGPILNELVRTRKPMSYYSDGQRVPEDLHVAPTEQMIEILLNRNEQGVRRGKDK